MKCKREIIEYYDRLLPVSYKAILRMFDSQNGLFCFREYFDGKNLVNAGLSIRYTAMACIGAGKENRYIPETYIDLAMSRLINSVDRVGIGDMALIAWAACVQKDAGLPHIAALLKRRLLEIGKERLKELDTMEIAWVLLALCSFLENSSRKAQTMSDITHMVFEILVEAYNDKTHLFYAKPSDSFCSPKGFRLMFRAIASFAQQIYPVFACATYYGITHNNHTRIVAENCAQTLMRHQLQDGDGHGCIMSAVEK